MSKSLATIARHPARAAAVLALALLALVVGIMSVSAVHSVGLFELDGDAVDAGGVTGDDWSSLYAGGGSAGDFTGIVPDPAPMSIFWTGGSKDDLDVSSWKHKDGSVPHKDDITNAYAASYSGPDGPDPGLDPDLYLYFGADRFANNGDANIAYWFFQNDISVNPDGTFSGVHVPGDILIVSEFSSGGDLSTIKVLEWVGDGSGDEGNGNLRMVAPTGVDCDPAPPESPPPPGAAFCGTTNQPNDEDCVAAQWPYTPKAANGCAAQEFPAVSFFEGGINVSSMFGDVCFASFMAMTRSSTSVRSQLKDFVLEDIDTCGSLKIVKDAVPAEGTDFDYDGTGQGIAADFDLDDSADSDTGADLPDSIKFTGLLPNGPRTVKENVPAGWQLDNINCELEDGGTPTSTIKYTGAAAGTDGFESGDHTAEVTSLTALEDIVCTFTNTGIPTLTVNKVLIPSSDSGRFNLQIDDITAGTGENVGDGGTTGAVEVSIGDHTVGETGYGATELTDYFAPVITGHCDPSGNVTLAAGEDKSCTITNTRRPTLTVNKVLIPSTDSGLFNLQIDDITAGTGANVGDGGTTGAVQVSIGGHTVGETAGTSTSLSDYFTPVISGDCDAGGNVTLAAGEDKSCTITNTRRPTLTVNKVLIPSSDSGRFNLQIDGSTAGTGGNVGDGGTTGPVQVSIGAHTAGETGAGGTILNDYTIAISGHCDEAGNVTLAAGDNKTCTIINTRLPNVQVAKDGTISYTITASNAGPGMAHNVSVTDSLPAGLTWTETHPNCTITGGTELSCTFGSLAQGATASVTVTATIADTSCTTTAVSNTADVTATNEAPSDQGDNSATVLICD